MLGRLDRLMPDDVAHDSTDPEAVQLASHRRSPVKHLVFVIHGIGENMWEKRPEWTWNSRVGQLRKFCDKISTQYFPAETRERVEYLPVGWHHIIHNTTFKENLERATINNIQSVRGFTNGALMDVLFYMSPAFHDKILTCVVDSLNSLFSLFCANHPGFNPDNVSVVGHSLGSVISFDVLQVRSLHFWMLLAYWLTSTCYLPSLSATSATPVAHRNHSRPTL
jgi:hypothetical protein